MAKLTREELERVEGKEMEELLREKRVRLSTTPFGAPLGKAIAYIGRSVPWKKRGRVPKGLHKV